MDIFIDNSSQVRDRWKTQDNRAIPVNIKYGAAHGKQNRQRDGYFSAMKYGGGFVANKIP